MPRFLSKIILTFLLLLMVLSPVWCNYSFKLGSDDFMSSTDYRRNYDNQELTYQGRAACTIEKKTAVMMPELPSSDASTAEEEKKEATNYSWIWRLIAVVGTIYWLSLLGRKKG